MKRRQYWNANHPYGMADTAREDLIHVDEAVIFLEACNRGMGKATVGKRVREEGTEVDVGHGYFRWGRPSCLLGGCVTKGGYSLL
jgi:hypothetical protein